MSAARGRSPSSLLAYSPPDLADGQSDSDYFSDDENSQPATHGADRFHREHLRQAQPVQPALQYTSFAHDEIKDVREQIKSRLEKYQQKTKPSCISFLSIRDQKLGAHKGKLADKLLAEVDQPLTMEALKSKVAGARQENVALEQQFEIKHRITKSRLERELEKVEASLLPPRPGK
jgi:hypothetical protein